MKSSTLKWHLEFILNDNGKVVPAIVNSVTTFPLIASDRHIARVYGE